MTPGATYRLQLHTGFTFEDAAAVVPYLARLGVTHLYLSPSLQAAPGSTHGYDVVDTTRLNDDLGGDAGFERLHASADAMGLGLVLDIVPNHVGLLPATNRWWWDVLQHGQDSSFARHFDIDWDMHGDSRVVVPELGGQLDDVIAAGELRIVEGHDDEQQLAYHDHRWPLSQQTPVTDDVHAVVAAQHYRLVHWRRANEELNYRRFFDVTKLGGVRIEDPEVFDAVHGRVLSLIAEGQVAGLRVDHPDGLWDPTGYARRLRDAAPDAWIVFEKILEEDERPRAAWPIDGTVGYEFLNLVLGQFVDPADEAVHTALYDEVMEARQDYRAMVDDAKREVVRGLVVAEHRRLATLLARAADDLGVDVPSDALGAAIEEVLVAHPVYRTYVRPVDGMVADVDAAVIATTMAGARQAVGADAEQSGALGLIEDVWRLRRRSQAGDEFVMRLQQVTGPVRAKGIEDTTFYRYLRFSALNEVGGDPLRFGRSLGEWHDANLRRNADWSATMLTTSTHDTKRSEDVRARLAAASQFPDEWAAAFARFRAATRPFVAANGPSPNHEYLAFQTAVGAWPISAKRLTTYLRKAAREEKTSTSWLDPDETYEKALAAYGRAVTDDPAIVAVIEDFVDVVGRPGRVVSLAQTLLKLTSPGVPDLYQGTEVWDLSLVDPDNRRPVDFSRLSDLLGDVAAVERADGVDVDRILAGGDVGLPKLWVTARTLRARRDHPQAFMPGAPYRPLLADGARADDVIAYLREDRAVTVVPRRVRERDWGDTMLRLPHAAWYDVLSGQRHDGGATPMAELLGRFPVALLIAWAEAP